MKERPFREGKTITKGDLAMSIATVLEKMLVSVPARVSALCSNN